MWGRARVRRDFSVLVSPWARMDRHTAALAGHGRCRVRVAEADVFPAQGAGFFGADAGGQAQGDVGVHPGALGGGQESGGLVQGQALARPPRLPFGGISQGGDVAAGQVAAFGVADRAGQGVVAHRHRGSGVPGRHRGEGLADVVGGQLAQSPGADRGQDRCQDVLVFLDRFRRPALQAHGEPVLRGAAEGVVRAGLHPGVQVTVQGLEPLLDHGPGLAGDFAADPFPVGAIAEADHSAPPARAIAVPFTVPA